MSIKQRIKKWCTIDHVVDLSVDIFLIIWDVITSPVLIVMRVLRHFIGEWFVDHIKGFFRWIAHWFERKSAWRKERGYGIFRTYWFLILPSPVIVLVLYLLGMIVYGMTLGYQEIKQEDPNSGIVKLLGD
jgi:hypothetical protein